MTSPTDEPDLTTVIADLASLKARIDALESGTPPAPSTVGDPLWALTGLKGRLPETTAETTDSSGAVLLTGSLRLPTGEPVEWQESRSTPDLLDATWSERATMFAALSHPVRLELLRQVLNGTRTTAELAELEELGTTGQLHHHLRQLLASGWLRSGGRGNYEVPPARIVPLLACIVAVA